MSPRPRSARISAALRTVASASQGLESLHRAFEELGFAGKFDELVSRILALKGRVILTGMGKSGFVARKVTATLTSTGTPAFFIHPAEAGHGDLGMITVNDLVLMFTRSGETAELASIISYCKRFHVPLVVVSSRARGGANRAGDLRITLPAVREACPIALSPTTSTTIQQVFGDALAVALMEMRGFSVDDFYRFHPNGLLGVQLLKVADLMTKGEGMPRVGSQASLLDATSEMTRTRFGGTAVIDDRGALLGVFTDGDLRRAVQGGHGMADPVSACMSRDPLKIAPDALASEALRLMQDNSVTMLFVVKNGTLAGVVHIHDALRVGLA